MILNLFRKNPARDAVSAVYNAIVAQSRQSLFYAEWGVPDTVTGRFDMITLHLALLFRRMRYEKKAGPEFSQAVFDLFFKDMDRSLREMGVTDLGVPKKIRKMGNIFFGLMTSLNEAMDREDRAGVETVLRRNMFEEGSSPNVAMLTDYLFRQYAAMAAQPADKIASGQIEMGVAA